MSTPSLNFKTAPPAGFTLVEIIIVTAIVALLATITSLSLANRDPSAAVHESKELYRTTLELARTSSLTGKACCLDTFPQGYGVYALLDNVPDTSYWLYADLNSDHVYSASNDQIISSGTLDQGVTFAGCSSGSIAITPGPIPPNTCDINFPFVSQPDPPAFYFNGNAINDDPNTTTTVTLQSIASPSTTATLKLYSKTRIFE